MGAHPMDEPGRQLPRVVGVVGAVFQVLVGVVPYAVSGLVAPWWGVVLLALLWLALLGVTVLLLRRRPMLTPVVPVVSLVVWFAVVTAGDAWFGWNA